MPSAFGARHIFPSIPCLAILAVPVLYIKNLKLYPAVGKEGVLGGGKVGEMQGGEKKKHTQPNLSLNNRLQ